jgi:glucose-6-phosphate isomerase
VQNHNIKIGDRSFENVAQFEYLETTVTNQNLIQEEITPAHLPSFFFWSDVPPRLSSGSHISYIPGVYG